VVSLHNTQLIILFFFIAIADVYPVAQKYFIPESVRPFSYLLFVVLIMLVFFFIVKPDDPMVLSTTLSVILGIITIILIIIQDVIIADSVSWRTGIILLGAVACPIAAGYCYAMIHSHSPAR